MALETYRPEDAAAMARFREAFVRWILPWKERMHVSLVAMVLIQCARVCLRLCEPADQAQLLPTLVAYLEGKASPPGGEQSLIWTPDQGGVPPGLM